jgi:hypothetical protein
MIDFIKKRDFIKLQFIVRNKTINKKKKRIDEKLIYLENNPTMSYVPSDVTQFNNNSSDYVLIKARGRKIRILVDTEEIVKK